jgi:DNA-binding transcriptional ArsR family regulator
MPETRPQDDEPRGVRDEYPSGWLVLTKHESAAKVVDALLDLPPRREFNQSELADLAGVSRQSVSRHLDLLLEIGVIEPVEPTRPQRYRFDPTSEVSRAIIRLDGAMNAAGPNATG